MSPRKLIMAISVVAVKEGLRNSVRSSIGLELRRSARTKAAEATTAVDRATITLVSVKEPAPPSMIP